MHRLTQQGSNIKYKVVLNGILSNSIKSENEFKDWLKTQQIDYLNSVISNRKVYKDSLFEGKAIFEISSNAANIKNAVAEFNTFAEEVLDSI